MAHYAEVIDGKVTRVLVIDNEWSQQETFDFLMAVSQHTWVQASYNSRIRGHYPALGDTYSEELDLFIAPKPYNSWLLNTSTGFYQAPIPMPNDDSRYAWDEETKSWSKVDQLTGEL